MNDGLEELYQFLLEGAPGADVHQIPAQIPAPPVPAPPVPAPPVPAPQVPAPPVLLAAVGEAVNGKYPFFLRRAIL